ncbi:hypothetical protein [Methylobacterium sp.]|uniref:thermonuclease family protein n=1 Tax=Methylobacterium sp. TaxID=409 RepID=UPI0025F3E57A|nr:hypothetical protein [Methylobacterium sp.]MBY0256520.1 hypothetical protein [Methylobacterium sp.]
MDERTSPSPAAREVGQAASAAGRDALRARIAEEIARQNVYPVAERTLSLLAEACLAPLTEAPFYRVVDRAGAPRLLTEADGRTVPMPIEALFAELRDRHPALFLPPPPEPEPVSEPQAEPAVPAEDFRVATARFVGAQSLLARSLMARSITRGRATAQAMSTAISDRAAALRPQRAPAADPSAAPVEGGAPAEPGRSARASRRLREGTRSLTGYARGRIADTTSRLRDVARDRNTLRDALSRRALPFGLIVGGVALVAGVTAIGGRTGTEEEASAPETRSQAQVQPPAAGNPPSAPDMSPALPEENQPKPARANELTGPVEVIDTATLRVAGKLVRLFGVEWVRGGQADELTRYLAGRTVTCQPVAGSEARLCAVDGRDLSEVVLFNGGGRASPEATPDLVAAEDHARAERLGVWAR